jgi:hypothetical protein
VSRLTKQGVPDLNAVGHNGHKNHDTTCRHWFGGPHVVIGTRWALDSDYGEAYEEPLYGQKCLWCPTVRELR